MPAIGFLVQLNVVPAVSYEGVYVNRVLLQTSGGASELLSAGVGLTVIVNVCEVPEQPTPPLVKVGVTVIVALIGEVPPLVAVNAGNEPVPPAPRPIVVFELLHE
jgi:hypothetical protein